MEGLNTPELVAKIKPYEEKGWSFYCNSCNDEGTLWVFWASKKLSVGNILLKPFGATFAGSPIEIVDTIVKLIEETKTDK